MRYLIKRKNWYYYKRRIPKYHQHHYGTQSVIHVSLKTTSEPVAIQRASILNSELEKLWNKLTANQPLNTDHEYQKAVQTAQSFNFSYRTIDELAQGDLEKIINRTQAIQQPAIFEKEQDIAALLGKHTVASLTISKALDEFFEFEKPNHTRKNADQLRKWKNPRIKAVKNFIQVCGDLPIDQITRADTLNFRSWWLARVESENLTSNTPNKDFSHLRTLIFFAKDHHALNIQVEELFSRIRFKGTPNSRPPFKTSFIKERLLHPKNLAGLNRECQLLLYAMADLGARPSELVGLNPDKDHIRLDTDIPFILIEGEEDREIKTQHSERIMPLVGASLYAFQQLENGFKDYYRKPDKLSNNINKFLRNNDLLPTDDHSVYSLRHSFEDRLTAVEPPDKVQAALMGHKYDRPRYGDGPSLEQKYKWLQKIAFNIDELF